MRRRRFARFGRCLRSVRLGPLLAVAPLSKLWLLRRQLVHSDRFRNPHPLPLSLLHEPSKRRGGAFIISCRCTRKWGWFGSSIRFRGRILTTGFRLGTLCRWLRGRLG